MTTLSGKKGLIIGIANEHSLAYGCARHFRAAGAELAITYINAKTEPYVRPLSRALQSEIFMPCDVTAPGQLEAVFGRIAQDWGRLDFVQHSVAYARKEDLSGRITDCSADGFAIAMNVSLQSFQFFRKANWHSADASILGTSPCLRSRTRRSEKSRSAIPRRPSARCKKATCGPGPPPLAKRARSPAQPKARRLRASSLAS